MVTETMETPYDELYWAQCIKRLRDADLLMTNTESRQIEMSLRKASTELTQLRARVAVLEAALRRLDAWDMESKDVRAIARAALEEPSHG
jgi:hypothetical protein